MRKSGKIMNKTLQTGSCAIMPHEVTIFKEKVGLFTKIKSYIYQFNQTIQRNLLDFTLLKSLTESALFLFILFATLFKKNIFTLIFVFISIL